MKNNHHDCLFDTVHVGKISVYDKMFHLLYPYWYKLKRLPSKLAMRYKRSRNKRPLMIGK